MFEPSNYHSQSPSFLTLFSFRCSSLQSRAEKVSSIAAAASEEGVEPFVARQRVIVASHCLVLHLHDRADVESAADIDEELGRDENLAAAAIDPGEPAEPVDGDHLNEPVDRTSAILFDEATLPPALV